MLQNLQQLPLMEKLINVDYYNLDVIISVGYRVKSKRGTQFRIWATGILKEYMRKGFVLDDDRLKESRRRWIFQRVAWKEFVIFVHPKKYFIVRFWKFMQQALIMIQQRKFPSNSSKKYKIKFIMLFMEQTAAEVIYHQSRC